MTEVFECTQSSLLLGVITHIQTTRMLQIRNELNKFSDSSQNVLCTYLNSQKSQTLFEKSPHTVSI